MRNSPHCAPVKHGSTSCQHRPGDPGRKGCLCAGIPTKCRSLSLVLFARLPLPALPLIPNHASGQVPSLHVEATNAGDKGRKGRRIAGAIVGAVARFAAISKRSALISASLLSPRRRSWGSCDRVAQQEYEKSPNRRCLEHKVHPTSKARTAVGAQRQQAMHPLRSNRLVSKDHEAAHTQKIQTLAFSNAGLPQGRTSSSLDRFRGDTIGHNPAEIRNSAQSPEDSHALQEFDPRLHGVVQDDWPHSANLAVSWRFTFLRKERARYEQARGGETERDRAKKSSLRREEWATDERAVGRMNRNTSDGRCGICQRSSMGVT